jgi:hypothetical protein
MNMFMLVLTAIAFLLVVSELHYRLAQWMDQASEVFEIGG